MKINLVLALKTRIEKISHHTLRMNNLNKLYNILLNNSYPKYLLKKLIYSTPQTNIQPQIDDISQQITNNIETNDQIRYFSLPYIKEINNQVIKLFKAEPKIKIAHKQYKTIGSILSKLKDKDEQLKMSNVVYSIPCIHCEGVYVGQTSRVLKERITSHRSDCRLKKTTCALSQHFVDKGHDFDFNNPKVLCNESIYNKRLFLEMVEILLQPNAINKRTDINDLSVIYSNVLTLNNYHNRNSTLNQTIVSNF